MKLQSADFAQIVKSTPLVSIDFIIRDNEGNVLLGQRTNRPAQGFWFVPGGRVLKDESLEYAFKRLVREELNKSIIKSKFKGIYQHFYNDNFSICNFTTHYVVLAYEIILDNDLEFLPLEQHSEYKWFSEKEMVEDAKVHMYSKWYLQENRQADAYLNNFD